MRWNMSGILIILWRIAWILLLIIIGIVITLATYIHMLFGVLLVSVFVLVPSRLLRHLRLSDVLITFMAHRLIAASSSILWVPTTRRTLLLSVLTLILLLLLILRWCLLLLLLIILLIHSMSSRIITSMTWSRIIRLVMLLLLMMHSLYTILLFWSLIIILRISWRRIWLIWIRIVGMLFADGMCVVLSILTVAVN